MRCTDTDVRLDGTTTADLHVELDPCPEDAVWRVSTPTDPWPLQYPCNRHLVSTITSLGGDVRVTYLRPGIPTPPPRTTAGE